MCHTHAADQTNAVVAPVCGPNRTCCCRRPLKREILERREKCGSQARLNLASSLLLRLDDVFAVQLWPATPPVGYTGINVFLMNLLVEDKKTLMKHNQEIGIALIFFTLSVPECLLCLTIRQTTLCKQIKTSIFFFMTYELKSWVAMRSWLFNYFIVAAAFLYLQINPPVCVCVCK